MSDTEIEYHLLRLEGRTARPEFRGIDPALVLQIRNDLITLGMLAWEPLPDSVLSGRRLTEKATLRVTDAGYRRIEELQRILGIT